MQHDWVTSNGINTMPRMIYPKLELTNKDTMNLFTRVNVIATIKLKFRQKL
jgi:hypothetical protein